MNHCEGALQTVVELNFYDGNSCIYNRIGPMQLPYNSRLRDVGSINWLQQKGLFSIHLIPQWIEDDE